MAWVKQSGGAEYTDRSGYRRLGYQTLCALAQNPGQLAFIRAQAHHPDVVPEVLTEEQAQTVRNRLVAGNISVKEAAASVSTPFTRGQIVKHTPSGRKVTIIKASAARKGGETLHEVVDASSGKRFLARELNLKCLR